MKKLLSILLTILLLLLAGCGKMPEKTPSNSNSVVSENDNKERSNKLSEDLIVQTESVVSAELSGYGKNVVIEDIETVEKIIQIINNFEFKETTKNALSVSGAVSLRIIISYTDGDKVDIGIPVWEANGKVYETNPTCVMEFSSFLEL